MLGLGMFLLFLSVVLGEGGGGRGILCFPPPSLFFSAKYNDADYY